MKILPELQEILGNKWRLLAACKIGNKWIVKAMGYGSHDDFVVWDYVPGKGLLSLSNSLYVSDLDSVNQEFDRRVNKE